MLRGRAWAVLTFSYFSASYASTETFLEQYVGPFCPLIWIWAHNILSKSSLHTHTPVHSHSIVCIKELMELHKDSGKPTLYLREIGKPFSTQRLFIISCVPFSLQSARKEHFPIKRRILGWRTHKEMRKTKGDFFLCQRFWQCNLNAILMALKEKINVILIHNLWLSRFHLVCFMIHCMFLWTRFPSKMSMSIWPNPIPSVLQFKLSLNNRRI